MYVNLENVFNCKIQAFTFMTEIFCMIIVTFYVSQMTGKEIIIKKIIFILENKNPS